MLRYSGKKFQLADGKGIVHEVIQVTKGKAKKAYENNETIWMHPCNMRVDNPWQKPYDISKAHITDPFALRLSEFERVVDSYTYYNCDNERGKYPIFFVEAA